MESSERTPKNTVFPISFANAFNTGSIVPIKPEVVVKVIECGPLRIGGHVRIMFSDGSMVIKQRAFICRCGKSSNQPFCDGSHVED